MTQTGTGGATTSVCRPRGRSRSPPTPPTSLFQVAVANTFDLGSMQLIKQLDGGGADDVADGTAFTLQLECQVLVNDEVQPVELEADGVITLTSPTTWRRRAPGCPPGHGAR